MILNDKKSVLVKVNTYFYDLNSLPSKSKFILGQ